MKRRKILYLGANPPGTARLGLDDEVRAIKQELRGARHRCFELVSCWATEANDLIRDLRESTPAIVHLSCHGCKAGGRAPGPGGSDRDAVVDRGPECEGAGEGGLVLPGRDGSVHVVSFALVDKMFALAGGSVKLVVLTACATEPLAALLLGHVDCAIGMDGPISDHAALEFCRGLYATLGDGASVLQAFQAGCLAIQCAGLPGADRPRLKVRDGLDASRVVLAGIPRRRKVRSRCGPEPLSRRSGGRGARPDTLGRRRRGKLRVQRAAAPGLRRRRSHHRRRCPGVARVLPGR